MAVLQPSLKARALRLLSGREHSRHELERKLARFETGPGELTSALDELQAKGFISEQRVLESVLHSKADKLGSSRLRQELTVRGLEPDMVRAALAQLKTSELERAQEVWRKKFGAPAINAQGRAKQMRFLLTRGFGPELLRQVVPSVLARSDADQDLGSEP